MSTITEYFDSLRGESIAVIGMGVSNTPLIKMMLRAGLKVTVCDKSSRERGEEQVAELKLDNKIHSFSTAAGGIYDGADWYQPKEELLKLIDLHSFEDLGALSPANNF